MKYLKKFKQHSEYTDPTIRPNVSYCKLENEVHYNHYHDYSKDYFTTVALESGTINFTILPHADTSFITSFAYSKNNGEWIETQNSDNREEDIVISVSVVEGDKIRWKGIANHISDSGDNGGVFTSTCRFNAQGNIMSLLYGDNFNDKVTLEDNSFSYLFADINNGGTFQIVNASNLIMPATTLASECYQGMFRDCTDLITAPKLPAVTLASYCYSQMFYDCSSLTTAPELPATTLAVNCYSDMFYGCTNLTTAPKLPATTLATYCYAEMFYGCTSLTTAPELPATTLASYCYQNMFKDCTNLTTAPELPATTLAGSCYSYMFRNCTSLTTTPELPVTTLANNCYAYMFSGCTSLTTAPELPATTLAQYCYENMFSGCTSLNYIKAMFTTTPSGKSPNYYTTKWVDGVAASGTFVKNSAATWDVTGVHGIPTGWTVQTASN